MDTEMKISELAERTGVPVSAVKYYLREGLLPDGEKSAPNQTQYGEEHVRRIRLIRALMGVGGLSMALTKDVIAEMYGDDPSWIYTTAYAAIGRQLPRPSEQSRQRVLALISAQRWNVTAGENFGADLAALALDALAVIDYQVPDEVLAAYATAAALVAATDLREVVRDPDPARFAELLVVGTLMGDQLFAGLRRLAQESTAWSYAPELGGDGEPGAEPEPDRAG
jgi:DNA-binding transcriptional MerR regulator